MAEKQEPQKEHQIESIKGSFDIDVKIDGKALILLAGVVYVAARAGTRKAIRKASGGESFFKQLKGALGSGAVDGLKKAGVWNQSTDQVRDQDGPRAGGTGLPDVSFEIPTQPGTTPGEESPK